MEWLGVSDLCPWLWDSDGKGMRGHEAKVERVPNPNTLMGMVQSPRVPTDPQGTPGLIQSALLLWRSQMGNCVNRVKQRPFLLSDLDQEDLFLETAASHHALGQNAGRTLLLFLNITVHWGWVQKCLWKSSEKTKIISSLYLRLKIWILNFTYIPWPRRGVELVFHLEE